MLSNLKLLRNSFLIMTFFVTVSAYAQVDTSHLKLQMAFGFNKPSQNGFVEDFESKPVNLSTFNIGFQYMFKTKLGVKLDYGFNRMKNISDTPEFKLNYTRVNAQLIGDLTPLINSIAPQIGLFAHAGPGYSFVRPLGDFGANKTSFLNGILGLDLHYGVTDALSVYLDTAYIISGAKEFDPISNGRGAFNGNVLTVTAGVSISLSGCYFCSRNE